MKYKWGFCKTCNKKVKAEKPKINHILHVGLTIITGGCWGFMYFLIWFNNITDPYICTTCGEEIK